MQRLPYRAALVELILVIEPGHAQYVVRILWLIGCLHMEAAMWLVVVKTRRNRKMSNIVVGRSVVICDGSTRSVAVLALRYVPRERGLPTAISTNKALQ